MAMRRATMGMVLAVAVMGFSRKRFGRARCDSYSLQHGQYQSRHASIGAVRRVLRQWLHDCAFQCQLGHLGSWQYGNGDGLFEERGKRACDVKHPGG